MKKPELLTSDMISNDFIKKIEKRFQSLCYKVDLLKEFFIISGLLVSKEEPDFLDVISDLFERYSVKEEDKEEFSNIHTYYYMLIGNFYVYLLNEDIDVEPELILIEKMAKLSDALLHQLPLTLRPNTLLENVDEIVSVLLMVFESYGLNINSNNFLEEVKEKMCISIYEKTDYFFAMMNKISEVSKMQTRVTDEMRESVKLIITNYIVICWDILVLQEEEA